MNDMTILTNPPTFPNRKDHFCQITANLFNQQDISGILSIFETSHLKTGKDPTMIKT